MKLLNRKLSIVGVLASTLTLIVSGTASAHVVVSPSEVITSSRATFAVSVPNEHDSAVVGVRLVIPEGLSSVRPFAKAGWSIKVTKTGEGENVTATEITWSGGSVPVDLKDDFLFGAKAPAEVTELKWKAYETYADGTVVAWEQDPSETEGNKPYSVTKVVNETAVATSVKKADQAAADAKSAANRAMYIGVAGTLIGLGAVYFATRKQ